MHITEFSADGFRNLRQVDFRPDEKLNLIIGDNAQGKTNLLDAVWLMTGCRNFHGVKEKHYLGFDADFFRCEMHFSDDRREQEIRYTQGRGTSGKRAIFINGVEFSKTGSLFDTFHCVAFSPADTELVTGTPERRRGFMDMCACQLRPGGVRDVSRAGLLLAQRNAGIQNFLKGRGNRQEIQLWDAQLAEAGAYLTAMRSEYIRNLAPLCERLYAMITGGAETLHISYRSSLGGSESLSEASKDALKDAYLKLLAESLDEDIRLGYTHKGFQRDDLQLLIDGKPVNLFGSQGQKKSTALVLKLAQAHLYNQKMNRSPVILLDDVMGELDERRQKLIYDTVAEMQVFITLCHVSSLRLGQTGKLFRMEQGVLTEKI